MNRIYIVLIASIGLASLSSQPHCVAEEVERRSWSRQQYEESSSSGVQQRGEARSQRELKQQDGPTSSRVSEEYFRKHNYQITTPRLDGQGQFTDRTQVYRTYYHQGDTTEIDRMNAFEKARLGLLSDADRLTTDLEKLVVWLDANAEHSEAERKMVYRKLQILYWEIGRLGQQIGATTYVAHHPDQQDAAFKEMDERLFRLEWRLSPHQIEEPYYSYNMKCCNTARKHLDEIRKSLGTPHAAYRPIDKSNWSAEIDERLDRAFKNLENKK